MRRPTARTWVALLALAGLLVGVPALAQASPAVRSGSGWSQTRTLTRDWSANGQAQTDTRHVRVHVDKTTDLQARERVQVSWTGAHPSGGRAANPYGENGLAQEYPVVIMECRGTDDPSLPAAKQLSPSTCFTSTWNERSAVSPVTSAVWLHDKYAAAADLEQQVFNGADPKDCNVPASFAAHIVPDVAPDGTVYSGCSQTSMPPEAAVGATDPPNEQEAFTSLDGSGTASFEVRTSTENATLGCSHDVPCSLVVVPIMGISCADTSALCNASGQFAPGSSNFAGLGVDAAVSPLYWWSASNWRNRFSVPLSFALPPSTCELLGSGPPVPFYGSELLSQAALQWSPAYCLRKDRFNWQANTMPDDAAFALMTGGQSVAAEVSGPRPSDGTDPVGYAPTAISGFGIAYDIDKPDNGGQAHTLRLNARLLAKLLTESYPGSTLGQGHPGLGKNPISINLDPEFRKLNPGLDDTHFSEAASTLLSLSTSSDVIKQVSGYIAADPEAKAFVDGKPDPWGMRVNPSYKGLALPVSTWPLLDTWIPDTPGQLCLKKNPAPYLPKVAAPVSNLRLIATAMLLSWPNVQTVCDTDPTSGLFKLGRIPPQGVGSRFMLGLVTLGDAARYGLDVAQLQAAPGSYVAADTQGLRAAAALAQPPRTRFGAFTLTQAKVRSSTHAYPGTMVVYTAARLRGMRKADAAEVAQFIRVSSTEGQRAGRGNGQLPDGYLPIGRSGETAPYAAAAARVATAVAAQTPARTTPTTPPPSSPLPPDSGAPVPAGVSAPATAPTASGAVPAKTAPVTVAPRTQLVAHTAAVRSGLGNALLPLLLLIGLAAGVVATMSRVTLRARGVR